MNCTFAVGDTLLTATPNGAKPVDARAWTTGDGPKAIFGDAVTWLRERGVLLPGVTTLARLVARVRDEATQRAVG